MRSGGGAGEVSEEPAGYGSLEFGAGAEAGGVVGAGVFFNFLLGFILFEDLLLPLITT